MEVQYFEMQHRAAAAAAMVLGTLLAATIVANQGNDNYDAAGRWAMAEAGSREDGQVSNRDVARESPEAMQTVDDNGNIVGYRGTPGSSDPYAYIRTGYYPKILAREAEVQRESASGHFATVHLGLDRWQEVSTPSTQRGSGRPHLIPSACCNLLMLLPRRPTAWRPARTVGGRQKTPTLCRRGCRTQLSTRRHQTLRPRTGR